MKKICLFIKYRMLFRAAILYLLVKTKVITKRVAVESLRQKKLSVFRKKYKRLLSSYQPHQEEHKYKKIIWSCWMQGIENAPSIVKACYSSIQRNKGDFDFILITDENYKDYVNIPSFIIEKYENGIIDKAHFSDVLRAYLLLQNGGIWMDVTTFMTSPIPQFVFDRNFFVFRHDRVNEESVVFNSSWFIFSVENSNLLSLAVIILENYLKNNNTWDEYFLFHLFVKLSAERLPDSWNQIYFYTDITCHNLYFYLFKQYDEQLFERIKSQSFVHKLTHKINLDTVRLENTFYDYIISTELSKGL